MASNKADVGHALLRVFLGFLFLIPGISKLTAILSTGNHPLVAMIGPLLFWLVLIVEIVCGLALIVGYKTQWVIWPLAVILLVALFMVTLSPLNMVNLLFHLLGIAALVSLYFTGPGLYTVDKN